MVQSGETVQSPYPPHSRSAAMAFVKELPSPEDRERYGTLLRLHEGRIWIADHERQIFLSGGQDGNPYYDDLIEAIFRMLYKGQLFRFCLYCRQWPLPVEGGRHVLSWDLLADLDPTPERVGFDSLDVLTDIKAALAVLGGDALFIGFSNDLIVRIGF